MRHGRYLAVLAVLVAAGCSHSKPMKDMVGYVPPTSLPAQPKRTLVAGEREQVWAQLVDVLEASAFEIDHIDEDKKLLVARYSGNPEPYIDCGSIVTHQRGTLGQLAGAAPTIALNYEIEEQPVVLNRTLNLDSRIIIRLDGQPQGTVIKTDATYVVTKTVDVVDSSGTVREGSRETVSFQAGRRGEFSKGTACQPNGSLDLAVLQSLPNIIGSDEIDRADLPNDGVKTVEPAPRKDDSVVARTEPAVPQTTSDPRDTNGNDQAKAAEGGFDELDAATVPPADPDGTAYDWVLPKQGLPTAALPTPGAATSAPESPTTGPDITALETEPSQPSPVTTNPNTAAENLGESSSAVGATSETAVLVPDSTSDGTIAGGESLTTIVDETTRKLLDSLDCGGEEWHFCDLVELTSPYRKRNIEKLFGLTINTTESFTAQAIGNDLKLDILFPSFPSHLHIAYARRDGKVEHIMSSSEVWPADLAHQLAEGDQTIPGPTGLAMIIAIASDTPLFPSPPASAEDATVYLGRLKQRLAELEAQNPDGSIAASQLLIFVENTRT
ncbi:MAG: hypothetical protein OEU92_02580 [Alphaproteobacteria bacterium]|nr:hypothetical protein [Alphaproteobacteria bacterium]